MSNRHWSCKAQSVDFVGPLHVHFKSRLSCFPDLSVNHSHFSICSQLSWRSHSRLHAKNPRLVCRRIKIDFVEFSRTYITLILMSATFWRMLNFPVSALASTWDEVSILDQTLQQRGDKNFKTCFWKRNKILKTSAHVFLMVWIEFVPFFSFHKRPYLSKVDSILHFSQKSKINCRSNVKLEDSQYTRQHHAACFVRYMKRYFV